MPQKLAFFQSIQDTLSHPSTLVHHNPDKTLWIDLDAFKEFGFGAVVFHTTADKTLPDRHWPSSNSIQPILYLSRLLTATEKNYWPTELETAGYVWMVKKVRHLIESLRAKVIIQTDHSAILDILQHSSITSTSSTMRLNLRLVRASQFLQQFKLDVRNKLSKEYIILDILSRLASSNIGTIEPSYSELDALFLYNTTFIKIHLTLVSRIIAGYNIDAWWS